MISLCARWGALAITYALLSGCHRSATIIEFKDVPLAEPGDPNKLAVIGGRVSGNQSNRHIVLYARSQGTWYVQPYANQPFTEIQTDSTWKSATHPGIEYAALLVGPDFRPIAATAVLPTAGVIGSAITEGTPPVWRRWWFLAAWGLLALFGVVVLHRLRVQQVANTLHVRFEERLAERTRVAQMLHDTLLQGVISASMQLHVAVDQLPADSAAQEPLRRVLQSMSQVIEEGRNTLRGLQSSDEIRDLERFIAGVAQELNFRGDIRVFVEARALPLRPAVRTDLYSLGREVLALVFQESQAKRVTVVLRCTASELREIIRHDGHAIDPNLLRTTGVGERAKRMGARLRTQKGWSGGGAIQIRIPGHIVFESHSSDGASEWKAALENRAS